MTQWRKLINLIVVWGLLFPTGVPVLQGHDNGNQSQNWKEYVDEKYGFALTVPTSWNIVPAQVGEIGSVTQLQSGEDAEFPIKVEIGVFVQDKPKNTPLSEWAETDSDASQDLVAQQIVTISRQEILQQNFDNGNVSGSILMFPAQNDKVYFISVMPLTAFHHPSVEKIVESFIVRQEYNASQITMSRLYPEPDFTLSHTQAPSGYRLPFVGSYTITSGPGCYITHTGRSSEAIDFGMGTNTPIYTTQEGDVVYATYGWNDGFGNLMKIQHYDSNISWYAHLNSFELTSGRVNWETHVANSGDTGYSSGPHLHFEVRNASNQSIWIRDIPGISWYSGDPNNPCQPAPDPDGIASGPPLGGGGNCTDNNPPNGDYYSGQPQAGQFYNHNDGVYLNAWAEDMGACPTGVNSAIQRILQR